MCFDCCSKDRRGRDRDGLLTARFVSSASNPFHDHEKTLFRQRIRFRHGSPFSASERGGQDAGAGSQSGVTLVEDRGQSLDQLAKEKKVRQDMSRTTQAGVESLGVHTYQSSNTMASESMILWRT